jgi:hypothetical protein
MAGKLSALQQRRVDEIQAFVRTVEHVKKLVAELDSNRAAKSVIISNISGTIERELSTMRQRALTANVGTLADQAGALAVLAGRSGGGLALKIRGLTEGVNSLLMQLDIAFKAALKADAPAEPGAKPF